MSESQNPYLVALEKVKMHLGTGSQVALCKCILSLYNSYHAFPISEILRPLDSDNTALALAMVNEYATRGETKELCQAGKWVYENSPSLIELSTAMADARDEVRSKWDRQREEENRRLYPEEYQ